MMNREEAIKIIDCYDIGFYDLSGEKIPADKLADAFDMAIEVLSNYTTEKPNDEVEQGNDVVAEPTDLISRADAIKAIESRQTEQWIDADVDYNNGLESAIAEINALPSADRPSGEWKIASEELPQRVGSYLVTCKGEHGFIYVDYDFWTVSDEFKYHHDNVIAWMTFLKPYKGGDTSNYTTKKPNDVVAEPTDLVSRAELLDRIKAVNSIPWGDDRGNAVKLVWSTEEVKRLIEKAPSADRPTLKQTDTMIIADALRYLMKDEERHLSDRTRADALREQFLNYGAKMGSD